MLLWIRKSHHPRVLSRSDEADSAFQSKDKTDKYGPRPAQPQVVYVQQPYYDKKAAKKAAKKKKWWRWGGIAAMASAGGAGGGA